MSSIFSSDFAKNLRRTQASTGVRNETERNGPQGEKNFARVLADLEKNNNTTSNTKELGADRARLSTPPNSSETLSGHISNLKPQEQGILPSPTPVPGPSTMSRPEAPLGETVNTTQGVNSFYGDVKMAAQEAKGPDNIGQPSIPKILSAKRVRDSFAKASKTTLDDYPKSELKEIITAAGRYHGIDPNLGIAVAQAESALSPNAVSKDGHASKGLFQLLDTTANDLLGRFSVEESEYEPFDPGMNSYLGMGYLRRLHDIFSDKTRLSGNLSTVPAKSAANLEKLAIAAFNTGEGNVARAQQKALSRGADPSDFSAIEAHLPASTQRYVQRVLAKKAELASNSPVKSLA